MDTFFTQVRLVELHQNVLHPTARQIFNFIRKARPEEPDNLETLKQFTAHFDRFQRFWPVTIGFRIWITHEKDSLNKKILMDVVYLDQHPGLQFFDFEKTFSTASFLSNISSATIFFTLLTALAHSVQEYHTV